MASTDVRAAKARVLFKAPGTQINGLEAVPEDRVLAGLMWLVHPNELLHGFDDRLCRGGIFECLGVRQLCDSVG